MRVLPAYKPSLWEKIVSASVAVGVVVLVAFLAVRNQPFTSPQIASLVRILVSLAVSTLGATIPGFLGVDLSGKGQAIRAGGALALFVITYFFSPALAPELSPKETITPLVNPRPVELQRSTTIPKLIRVSEEISRPKGWSTSRTEPQGRPALKVLSALQGDDQKGRKEFDFTISNSSDEQHLLRSFHVRWIYEKGFLSAIDHGMVLKPQEQYSIVLPIDVDKEDKVEAREFALSPPILLPPRNESGPSVATFRLEVSYKLTGRLDYHPNSDWDFYYEVSVDDDAGGRLNLLSREWRHDSNKDWGKDYPEPPEPCFGDLPQFLQSHIGTDDEGNKWTIVQPEHLAKGDLSRWERDYPGQCPGVATGHFNSKTESSFVVALYRNDKEKGQFLEKVLLVSPTNFPLTRVVVPPSPITDIMVIRKVPEGNARTMTGNTVRIRRDSFIYGELGGDAKGFYYDGAHVKSFAITK